MNFSWRWYTTPVFPFNTGNVKSWVSQEMQEKNRQTRSSKLAALAAKEAVRLGEQVVWQQQPLLSEALQQHMQQHLRSRDMPTATAAQIRSQKSASGSNNSSSAK